MKLKILSRCLIILVTIIILIALPTVCKADINWTEAGQSMTNLSNSNYSMQINMSEYTDITNLTNVSLVNQTITADAIFSPFEVVYVAMFGDFIYYLIIGVIVMCVAFKSRNPGSIIIAIVVLIALVSLPGLNTVYVMFSMLLVILIAYALYKATSK